MVNAGARTKREVIILQCIAHICQTGILGAQEPGDRHPLERLQGGILKSQLASGQSAPAIENERALASMAYERLVEKLTPPLPAIED